MRSGSPGTGQGWVRRVSGVVTGDLTAPPQITKVAVLRCRGGPQRVTVMNHRDGNSRARGDDHTLPDTRPRWRFSSVKVNRSVALRITGMPGARFRWANAVHDRLSADATGAPAKPRNAGTGGTASRAAFLACQKPVDRTKVPACMVEAWSDIISNRCECDARHSDVFVCFSTRAALSPVLKTVLSHVHQSARDASTAVTHNRKQMCPTSFHRSLVLLKGFRVGW